MKGIPLLDEQAADLHSKHEDKENTKSREKTSSKRKHRFEFL